MSSFILAKVKEDDFWGRAHEGDPGDVWLLDKFPLVHQWLQENAIEYRILFEYVSPFTELEVLQIRIEIEHDGDAI
jgi:hypothetical protein